MKTKALAVTFVFELLISAILGLIFINLAIAQITPMPTEPDSTPLTAYLYSPSNRTYNSNNIFLTGTVVKPGSWFVHSLPISYVCKGEIKFVRYRLDGIESENIPVNDIPYGDYPGPVGSSVDFSINLTKLPEGPHRLSVSAEGRYYYYIATEQEQRVAYNTVIGNTSEVRFTIDTLPPKITILSIQNETIYTKNVTLNFTLNEPLSWMAYSLDSQANATIPENMTLTGLSYGSHNLTLYARDTAGNIGASETVYFTIAQPPEPLPTTLVVGATAIIATSGAAITLGVVTHRRKRSASSRTPSLSQKPQYNSKNC